MAQTSSQPVVKRQEEGWMGDNGTVLLVGERLQFTEEVAVTSGEPQPDFRHSQALLLGELRILLLVK